MSLDISQLLNHSLNRNMEDQEQDVVTEDETVDAGSLNLDLESVIDQEVANVSIDENVMNNMIGAVGAGVAVNAVLEARYESRCACEETE